LHADLLCRVLYPPTSIEVNARAFRGEFPGPLNVACLAARIIREQGFDQVTSKEYSTLDALVCEGGSELFAF
jgi:hypothetical protein